MNTEEALADIRENFIGSSIDYARKLATDAGWKVRVVEIDKEKCVGTCDFDVSRINVVVEDGVITEVAGLG